MHVCLDGEDGFLSARDGPACDAKNDDEELDSLTEICPFRTLDRVCGGVLNAMRCFERECVELPCSWHFSSRLASYCLRGTHVDSFSV